MNESDWKSFRKHVPEWRERYLEKKNQEIVALLTDKGKTPTQQFWDAEKQMAKEARILTQCLDDHSRSRMNFHLILMYRYGMIHDEDLGVFSKELQEFILRAGPE